MKYTLVLATIAGAALITSANAQNIVEYGSMPSGTVLVSQLTDLGPGVQDNNRDYANNTGPAGQTFQVATAGNAGTVVVLGRGDSASIWNSGGAAPFDGTEQWVLQLGTVGGTGAITPILTDNITGFTASGNIADYLAFNLSSPIALSTGVTYEYTISIDNAIHHGDPWMGWAHSTGDALASGYAMNNNTSMANPGGGDGGTTPVMGGFAAPNPGGYDFAFAILQVPEPTTIALLGLGGLALVAFRRRA
jgi:PEP-CTERM motif